MGQPKDYLTAVDLARHKDQLTALLRIAIAAFNFVTCVLSRISLDQFKVFELDENTKSIVDDVQKVYAAQVFDAFTVKVSFISQEISKIEQTQSQHQASNLQLVVPTRVKTIAFS